MQHTLQKTISDTLKPQSYIHIYSQWHKACTSSLCPRLPPEGRPSASRWHADRSREGGGGADARAAYQFLTPLNHISISKVVDSVLSTHFFLWVPRQVSIQCSWEIDWSGRDLIKFGGAESWMALITGVIQPSLDAGLLT